MRLRKILELNKEEEEKQTFTEIEEGVFFRGHNLWLLVIAMVIACVGLTVNSTSAIIGAMLISPLMGPVVGLSFGMAIHNKHLMQLSLHNWVIMVRTSLLASTLFFLISPFHQETDQLASFKQATIFDCMLALFGGFAWFLGIIKKEAIKVIAGVAVATSCIPPLCTAGYGLANGNWEYFFGGFYFYVINCFFIGIGTWVLSIVLGYRKYFFENSAGVKDRKTVVVISILTLIILIPSIFLTIRKWKEEKLKENANSYIQKIQEKYPEIAVIKHETSIENDKNFLDITILNDKKFLDQNKLHKANDINKNIHLRWHYSSNSELKFLQNQIDELRKKLETKEKIK